MERLKLRKTAEKPPETPLPQLPRISLTQEQQQQIARNREAAIKRQKEAQKNYRNAENPIVDVASERDKKRQKYEIPAIKSKDYIEYDFSTLRDSRGGFLDSEEPHVDPVLLQEWKERQKKEHVVKDLAPPLDLANAPKCFECGSLEIDPNFYSNFRNVRVCRRCTKEKPDKYSLLTKTECREDYLLTEPELKDVGILPRIEKPNPHGFSRMQLFLRFQVEEYAWKKWGSAEGLDREWERREAARLLRRDKKYQNKMKEMRKKTRAEEYTRKLRNGQRLGERHVHKWAEPIKEDNVQRRRCIECGIETEDVII